MEEDMDMTLSTELLTSINDALYISAGQAALFMHNDRGADAMCLLNEWTTPEDVCLLTKYLKGEITEDMGSFTYINLEEESWGEFVISDDGE